MCQVLGFLPLLWETQTQVQSPDFSLAKPELLQVFGQGARDMNLSRSAFQIKLDARYINNF